MGDVVFRCVQNICDTVYMGLCGVCVECCICILCGYVQCVSMCGVCVQFMECVGVWGGMVLGIWVYMYCVVM